MGKYNNTEAIHRKSPLIRRQLMGKYNQHGGNKWGNAINTEAINGEIKLIRMQLIADFLLTRRKLMGKYN